MISKIQEQRSPSLTSNLSCHEKDNDNMSTNKEFLEWMSTLPTDGVEPATTETIDEIKKELVAKNQKVIKAKLQGIFDVRERTLKNIRDYKKVVDREKAKLDKLQALTAKVLAGEDEDEDFVNNNMSPSSFR